MKRSNLWRYVFVVFALAFALFPIVWAMSAAFNPTSALATQQLLPGDPSLQNFRTLFNNPDQPFWRWFFNSMIVATVQSTVAVMLCSLSAFAFSRLRFSGRRYGLIALLLLQMFPSALASVALFLLIGRIGDVFPFFGLGTNAGLVLASLGGVLGVNTWLMKAFFDSIPRELDESAVIDGASHAQIFRIIILPLAKPILAVMFLLTFIASINDYLVPSVLLSGDPKRYTLSVGLFNYVQGRGTRFGPFAAGALIASIPVVSLFFFLQRHLTDGLTQGAVKG
jgi:arabinogalactan oligomer / maltooligosaccharide transport system permease protein